MADAATQRLVDQIVTGRIQAGALFTAYDVTLEARRRGGNIRHNDVRDLVHEYYEQGRMGAAYNRSTIDVGAKIKPFLYHRFVDDPNSYRPPADGGSAVPTPTPKPGLVARLVNKLFGSPTPPVTPPRMPAAPIPTASGSASTSGSAPAAQPTRKSTTLGLDASPFLPITRDDLKSAMKGTNLWSSVWFGRRDLIPPVDDKRTLLVDRAMVSQGLLSPDQLAEIHRVGAEMDLVRPDLVVIHLVEVLLAELIQRPIGIVRAACDVVHINGVV